MSDKLFTTAIKNGQYVSIDKFNPGEGHECGCTCPECGEQVVSNVTAKTVDELKISFTNHFSHSGELECSGGHGETELHLLAKQILEENNSIVVPSINVGSKEFNYHRAKSEPAFPSEKHKQKRPDILLYDDNDKVICAIEIIVTNPLSQEKKELYISEKIPCLEIDLNLIHRLSDHLNKHEIHDKIINKVYNKTWVWTDEVFLKAKEPINKPSSNKKELEKTKVPEHNVGVYLVSASLIYFAGRWLLDKITGRK